MHAINHDIHELQLEQEDLATECLSLVQRRLKCYSSALVNAGPLAGCNFTAPYKIWHGKRLYFLKPGFQPDAIEKNDVNAALAKTNTQAKATRRKWSQRVGKTR